MQPQTLLCSFPLTAAMDIKAQAMRQSDIRGAPCHRLSNLPVRLLLSVLAVGWLASTSHGEEPKLEISAGAQFSRQLSDQEFVARSQIGYAAKACVDRHDNCMGAGSALEANLFENSSPDRAGLWRDTRYFIGYQAATIGILYALPEGVSGWTKEQKEGYSMSIWWDNVTHPQIDSDDFYINYLLHPYWGGAYFVRARERGYSRLSSFWYSVFLSSSYEFGLEALFEEPSIQDVIATPIMGSLVGMYFMHVRDNIRRRDAQQNYRSTKDKWLWVLTDPLGSLNRQFDRLFGWEANARLQPYIERQRVGVAAPPGTRLLNNDIIYGVEFSLRW